MLISKASAYSQGALVLASVCAGWSTNSGFHFCSNALFFVCVTGNIWLVKFNGLVLQPMARTNHKFPVMENVAFEWK